VHNEDYHVLYTSPNIIIKIKSRRIIWVGRVARMREVRNAHKILILKSEEKRPFTILRNIW
jgi:hypothetical protein